MKMNYSILWLLILTYTVGICSGELSNDHKVLHLSFHQGCIEEFAEVGKELGLQLTSWFILSDSSRFDGITKSNDIYNINHKRAERIWNLHKEYFDQFDAVVTSDTAPLSRIFLQNGWSKPLIIWVCNRFDYADTSIQEYHFPDQEYYELFKKATTMPNVKIISYTPYEYIHAAQKGVNIGTFTIKPIGKCENHYRNGDQSYIPSDIDKSKTIFLHPRFFGCPIERIKQLLNDNEIPFYFGTYNGPYDLKDFKGILSFPYAWSTLSMFENIQNGLVHFVPSETFMLELLKTGWAKHQSIASNFRSHFFKVSELYLEENKPVIVYFDSWQDLKNKINSLNYTSMHTRILQFADQHKTTMLNRWQDVFNYLFSSTKSIATSSLILEKYKFFLENGTYEGQDWSSFSVKPKSRYYTFKKAFEIFEKNNGHVVVELGTSRSFVHGGHPGCNQDDPKFWHPENPVDWDWGAGSFTRVASECLRHIKPLIHTVDYEAKHITRCQIMTKEFSDMIRYHVCSSETFLSKVPEALSIDLLYMDTGDMTPIEQTAQLHLREAKIVVERDLISPNGIIVIDDVRNQTPKKFGESSDFGKAKYSIPFLQAHGFEIIEDEYQVILRKGTTL